MVKFYHQWLINVIIVAKAFNTGAHIPMVGVWLEAGGKRRLPGPAKCLNPICTTGVE